MMCMLFWDEWLGFDWMAFRQFLFSVGCLSLMISLIATTEGYAWWQPYASVWGFFASNATISIIGAMFAMTALFWFWRFKVV